MTMNQVYGYRVIKPTMSSSWTSRVQMVGNAEMTKLASYSLRLFFLTVIPQKFERKSALFALACSRVVIVNMWENQVGLHNGANMGLLKIIFEEHFSLYGNLDKRYVVWTTITGFDV
jgi:hypothetical protein